MEAYKKEFIEFMVDCQVLKFGDFVTKSGRKTPFFVNTGFYRTGAQLRRLGQYYAEAVNSKFGLDFDVLFGPAYKGIPLSVAATIAISEKYGQDIRYCSNRKEVKDHGDCNGFYASVECLHHPEIRNKPVAVSGDAENRHGIILAKNEIAKKYNIKTGEAIWQAKQKCPDLITVPPHFDLYKRFSKMARRIYSEYTDKIEPFGLDEAWLDVTDNKNMSGKEIALEINRRIKQELGITVSIGVSFNKIFAKFGSDYKKPDAITEITRENYRDIVWSCPAKDLLYVGRATGSARS